jgi:hypothetical protein
MFNFIPYWQIVTYIAGKMPAPQEFYVQIYTLLEGKTLYIVSQSHKVHTNLFPTIKPICIKKSKIAFFLLPFTSCLAIMAIIKANLLIFPIY